MSTNEITGKHDRDELVVAALAAGASYAEAGKAAGISKATVARRMSEPAFRGQVIEAREQMIDQVRGALSDAAPAAAAALMVLAADASSESVRLGAASRLLDLVLRRRPGFDTLTTAEAALIFSEIVERALARLPEDQQEAYVREVNAIGQRCS